MYFNKKYGYSSSAEAKPSVYVDVSYWELWTLNAMNPLLFPMV